MPPKHRADLLCKCPSSFPQDQLPLVGLLSSKASLHCIYPAEQIFDHDFRDLLLPVATDLKCLQVCPTLVLVNVTAVQIS